MSATELTKDTAPKPHRPSRPSGPLPPHPAPGSGSGPLPPAPPAGATAELVPTAHRVLIGVVVAGAVVIAGIGFAGSYAAVRELALKKGFGNFSYVFPIGIDAGICVLLALDLLLTWIRIPFPLLRQTAWLLTMATIAFNGAAAWPDPLGVGMHAVIPILFVVSVEAARHAIGRMADITADKHMEGVRLTRWLLSPLPTFLLWRRMKLWELRSYEQVIKLEQERLVYQARLHARFGRAWRRKAPVESLMPLRLARYGVPLAETAPSGLAAAGIDAAPVPPAPAPAPNAAAPPVEQHLTGESNQPQAQTPARMQEVPQDNNPWFAADASPQDIVYPDGYDPTSDPGQEQMWAQYGAGQPQTYQRQQHAVREGTYRQPASEPYEEQHTYDVQGALNAEDTGTRPTTSGPNRTRQLGEGGGTSVAEPDEITADSRKHTSADTETPTAKDGDAPSTEAPSKAFPHQTHSPPEPARTPTHTALHGKRLKTDTARDRPAPAQKAAAGQTLTTVDRYYLAWTEYLEHNGNEPTGEQLSAFLANKSINIPSGTPVSPSTLRRYYVAFRIYRTWANHRKHAHTPTPEAVARDCTEHGITAQYNKPITPHHITRHATDFERRWHTLAHDHTPPSMP
ncbi:DUF2637 domain-containing protein [Streptomyces sp. B21-083]